MTKVFCDICKKEIECDSEASEYKMKRLTHSFRESWWVRMTVHKDCWRERGNSDAQKDKRQAGAK